MLRKLIIQNYAIIDEIEINFSSNLNVITGETGAGKSILMGALSLILGERADISSLQNRQKKCIVEGVFLIDKKPSINSFFATHELDYENELVVRREISANGKSRGFINDTPATLYQLKELASLLVDLHQQFDTLELGDTDFQREVLDGLASNTEIVSKYQALYKQWQQSANELNQLRTQKELFQKEFDYHQYLFNELDQLGLSENELENIESELSLLSNSEEIKKVFSKVYLELKEKEEPIVTQLKLLANQLQHYASFHAELPELIRRLQSSQIELQDVADEVEKLNDHIHFDQQRIEVINERLSAGYKLLKKHGVHTTEDLLKIKYELSQKLEAVLTIDDTILKKEKMVADIYNEAEKTAAHISSKRNKEIPAFEKNVNTLLHQVGMPNSKLKVQMEAVSLNAFGCDAIEFLFDANLPSGKSDKRNRFEPIRKVASGGELSRLMLCIKSLVAKSVDLSTLIFDEIDTGISGEAAKQVGAIMKELSANRQIISITHQPQIAGKADTHFFVYKEIKGDAIKTNIRILNHDERITAIAKMLSGEKPTAAALENAREMVMN